MPAEVTPPELARLVTFSERPRLEDWSLRAALCRYAQPHPERVREMLDVVRRIEFAIAKHTKRIEREGPDLWAALRGGSDGDDLLGLLGAVVELDELGDVLADWAVDRAGKHPEERVDAVVTATASRLDELGIPREERVRPPGAGDRGV
jgi:hypothetical protein